jgi:hypothetical protein
VAVASRHSGFAQFHFHGIHYQNPPIRWIRLPMAFHEQLQIFHGQYLRAAMRQLYGPVAAQDLPWVRSHRGGAGHEKKSLFGKISSSKYLISLTQNLQFL